jgi:hypothetical protein
LQINIKKEGYTMSEYKSVYLFQAFDLLKETEVYILDREKRKVLCASELSAGELADIVASKDANRYELWIEEKE